MQTASMILDSALLVEMGITLFAGLGLSSIVAAPFSSAAVFVALGAAHEAAINEIRKGERLSGLSRGIVLGVDGRKPQYVHENFIKNYRNYNVAYPHYREEFANEYQRALAAGYALGLHFDEEAQVNFFRHLFDNMRVHPAVTYGSDVKQWSHRDWINYYIECAAVLKRLHLR